MTVKQTVIKTINITILITATCTSILITANAVSNELAIYQKSAKCIHEFTKIGIERNQIETNGSTCYLK